jgi:hypothetical protein
MMVVGLCGDGPDGASNSALEPQKGMLGARGGESGMMCPLCVRVSRGRTGEVAGQRGCWKNLMMRS